MKDYAFAALSIVFICIPVAYMVTGKYEIIFGGILGAACATLLLLNKKPNKSK